VIINNAGSRCSVVFWTNHLKNLEENERAELKQIRGLKATNLKEALLEMQEEAAVLPRLKNFMYHADFNPRAHERLTEKEWERAFEIFEKQRGIPEGTPRIVYEHEKEGRVHRHVIWSRLDVKNMRAFPDGLDWEVAHKAARKIEWELGLQRTIGPLDREPGTPRPPRAPKAWEMYRAMKTGIDPRDITAQVTELFHQSDNGKAFHAALEEHGYRLATGRRGLLILDSAGKEHSLAKRIDGTSTKELNAFMRDVDRGALPTVEQAKEQYRERKIAGLEADRATVQREIEWEEALAKAAIEKEKNERRFVEPGQGRTREQGGREIKRWPVKPPEPERVWASFEEAKKEAAHNARPEKLRGPAAEIWKAWTNSESAKTYREALDEKGIALAVVTKDEAARSHREAAFAREIGRVKPRYREGEIVVVTKPGLLRHSNGEYVEPSRVHRIDQSLAQRFILPFDRSQVQGIDATKLVLQERAQQRSAAWEALRLENATQKRGAARSLGKDIKSVPAALNRGALRTVSKLFDVVSSGFESLIAPVLTPEQKRDAAQAKGEREAEAANTIDLYRNLADRGLEDQRQQDHAREHARTRERGGRDR
jgi:hypothetical protein